MENLELKKILGCPECNGNLEFSDDSWNCPKCKVSWTVDKNGVIHILSQSRFFGADQKGMNKLLKEMQTMSAEEFFGSIERLETEYGDFKYSYCLDPARAEWTVLGDFSNKTVVDLGSGFGTVSIPLAKRARHIICVDAAEERIEFLALVANFRGVKNIVPIHGDVRKLPLKRCSVDAFILMGLLEWAGTWEEDESPKRLQLKFLSNLKEYLADEGEIWIGIENRLNPLYFVGKTDHGDLPFTPLMPRKLADLFTYVAKGKKFRTYTYSERGYMNLLQDCGYNRIKTYYSFPNYENPEFISARNTNGFYSAYIKKSDITADKSLLFRFGFNIYRMLGLYNTFAPCFIIQARK